MSEVRDYLVEHSFSFHRLWDIGVPAGSQELHSGQDSIHQGPWGILLLGPFLPPNVHLSHVPKKKAKQDVKVPKRARVARLLGWFHTGAGPLSGDPESSSPGVIHVQVRLLLLGGALESPSYEEACLGTSWFLSVNLMLFPSIQIQCSFLLFLLYGMFIIFKWKLSLCVA